MVGNLARLSSGTHLTTLLVMVKYLHENPMLRNTRVVLILSMGVLLLANTILEGHESWYDSGSFPAQCLFDNMPGHVRAFPMSFSAVIITILYLLTIVSLYDKPYHFLIMWFYEKPLVYLDDRLQAYKANRLPNTPILLKFWSGLVTLGLLIVKFVIVVFTTFIGSNHVGFLTTIVWLAIWIQQTLFDRNIPGSEMDGNENEMTFGQVLTILLLSSTALTIGAVYLGKYCMLYGI